MKLTNQSIRIAVEDRHKDAGDKFLVRTFQEIMKNFPQESNLDYVKGTTEGIGLMTNEEKPCLWLQVMIESSIREDIVHYWKIVGGKLKSVGLKITPDWKETKYKDNFLYIDAKYILDDIDLLRVKRVQKEIYGYNY